MKSDPQQSTAGPESQDEGLQFTITLEEFNSAFGISADTLRALAESYGVTPEKLITRAITMWAKADIPELDLDSPKLSDEQLRFLADRRRNVDTLNNQPPKKLEEAFRQLLEGKGNQHEDAESDPRDGGNT